MDSIQNNGTGISIQGEKINNLRFADDTGILEKDRENLWESVCTLSKEGEAARLKINSGKTKTMVFGKEKIEKEIQVGDEIIENDNEFTNLGSVLAWENVNGVK